MDQELDLSKINLEEKRLLSKAFETFNSSIAKLRKYQAKLEEQIVSLSNELEIKNQELTNVLQSLSSGLVVTDLEGRVQTFNRAAVSLCGISAAEAKGQGINQLLGFEVLPWPLDQASLALIEQNHQQEFHLNNPNGARLTLASSTTLMRSEEQESQGIIINLADITELKRLEAEAERKNRLTAMGQIAMQVAHEIRNPLGSIELFVSMLQKDFTESSEEGEMMNHIMAAIHSMNHIISNLLEYSRPKPIHLEPVNLNEILKDFMDFSRHSAAQQAVETKLELKAKQPRVLGSAQLLKQVFLNLFVNACQSMEEEGGGNFTICTSNYLEKDPLVLERFHAKPLTQGKGLKLLKVDFVDTGKGMTPEVQKRLFDPFFTTREQGTGLGMSIAHKTMASHGGTILVDSKVGEGTKISLLLPLYSE